MQLRNATFGVLGVLSTLLGASLLFAPGLVYTGPLPAISDALTGTDPRILMFVAAVLTLSYLLVAGRTTTTPDGLSRAEQRFARARTTPPEAVTTDRQLIAAGTIDTEISGAITHGEQNLAEIRELLTQTALTVLVQEHGYAQAPANDQLRTGTWTPNRTAAYVLAGDDGPSPPLKDRFRLWLVPERERRRRIEETIGAIEDLQERQ